MSSLQLAVLVVASFVAGAQNALAGGGSFLTLPALIYAGLDPRAANINSTIGLFPAQVTTSIAGRSLVAGVAGLSVWALFWISLAGGGLGAILLLETPVSLFSHLIPWLILFATVVFAWGSFGKRPHKASDKARIGPITAGTAQFFIAIYGGYFGGGIGFLMLAALTAAGAAVRNAGATKNLLAGVMNVSALLIFIAVSHVYWMAVFCVAVASIGGGQFGVYLMRKIKETYLRIGITAIGLVLTAAMFWRGA